MEKSHGKKIKQIELKKPPNIGGENERKCYMKNKSCAIVGLKPSTLPYYRLEDDIPEDDVVKPDDTYEDTSYLESKLEQHPDCLALKHRLQRLIEGLMKDGVTDFLCPVEQGVGMWAAEIILKLSDEKNPLTLTLVSAWEEEANNWNSNARYRLFDTIYPNPVVKTLRLGNHYTDTCVKERDDLLVERADVLIALDNGNPDSNLGYTVEIAKKSNKKVMYVAVA